MLKTDIVRNTENTVSVIRRIKDWIHNDYNKGEIRATPMTLMTLMMRLTVLSIPKLLKITLTRMMAQMAEMYEYIKSVIK